MTTVVLKWQNNSLNHSKQKIYRGTNQSNLTLLAEVSASTRQYADVIPVGQDASKLIYQISSVGTKGGVEQEVRSTIIGGESDEHYDNVVALFNFDDGTITDLSKYHHPCTAQGTTAVSAAAKHTGDYGLISQSGFTIPSSNAIDIPVGGSFTFESWIYFFEIAGRAFVYSNDWTSGSYYLKSQPGGALSIGTYESGQYTSGSNVIQTNKWHHIVYSMVNGTLHLYVDGTRVMEAPFGYPIKFKSQNSIIAFGSQLNSDYMDDIRLTLGVGRYNTPTIPVPTQPYPTH